MALIKWNKEYSVGVTKLDNQHKKIIKIVNEAIGQQFSQPNEKEIEEILDSLQDYIREHFKTEEEYMLKHQYSGYEEQRNEHNQFIDRLFEAQKEYSKNGRVTSINVCNFVWDWFSHHILIVDKMLSKIDLSYFNRNWCTATTRPLVSVHPLTFSPTDSGSFR